VAPAASGRDAPAGDALHVGFVGNGVTPTNHLAIEWFLDQVWPEMRRAIPALRLRLVGFPPDDRPKKQHSSPCKPDGPTRCGWAWGTQYAGKEVAGGIDALGFLSSSDFVSELLGWRAMVVPILRSTGVNTKLLPALQWGVPIVLTSVAANPLAIPPDDSVALIADDAARFIAQLSRLLSDPPLWRALSAASSAHWTTLLEADRRAADVSQLAALACAARNTLDEARPLALPHAPRGAARKLIDDLQGARAPPASRCFARQEAPAVLVALHGASAGEGAALWVHELWEAICRHCELRCLHGAGGKRARRNWDVLVEHELTLEPSRLARATAAAAAAIAPRPLRLVHLASSQWHAAMRYFEHGASLASTVLSEAGHAQLPAALASAGLQPDELLWRSTLTPLHNRSTAAVGAAVRVMLQFLGVAPAEEDLLVAVAESTHSRLARHETAPQWLGCFSDRADDRDLPDGPRTFGHTTQACAAACTGYAYLALQGGGQCFCGRSYGAGANHSRAPDNKCGHVCPGEEAKSPVRWCGGGWRNAVYSQPRGSTAAFPPVVAARHNASGSHRASKHNGTSSRKSKNRLRTAGGVLR